jgi:pentatricopeptide repeat protein
VKYDTDKEVVDELFYTALVEAAIRVGKADVAEQIIQRMHENRMVPSICFLQSVLKLFAARKCFKQCIHVWDLFEPPADQVIYSCLSLAAAESGNIELAREFVTMSQKNFQLTSRDYIPLFRALGRKKDYEAAAVDLRNVMKSNVVVENIGFNTVLSICVHAPDLTLIQTLMEEMRVYEKEMNVEIIDIVSYNTLMKAAAKQRDVAKCFSVLAEITKLQLEPDDVTFSTLLDICINEEELQLASVALQQLCESGVKMNCVLLTTLMKGFIRSKHLDKAMHLYETMENGKSQVKPDIITYSILIRAQCDNGHMGAALKILEAMLKRETPIDDVVFTHLLEGCCNVSNVALAEKLFHDMLAAQIQPSIYTMTAMVKVYGKCAQSEKAWELVQTMGSRFNLTPTVVIYTCLISGLLRQKKYHDAYQAFKWMKNTCTPDSQCVCTMITGLADEGMCDELLDVITEALGLNIRVPVEVYNHALAKLCLMNTRAATDIYEKMKSNKLEVSKENMTRLAAFPKR